MLFRVDRLMSRRRFLLLTCRTFRPQKLINDPELQGVQAHRDEDGDHEQEEPWVLLQGIEDHNGERDEGLSEAHDEDDDRQFTLIV